MPKEKVQNIRLQVFLSHTGVCSRRKALAMVLEGKVSVNGKTALEPSLPVDPFCDKVEVDGHLVEPKKYTYIMLNKPPGVTTTKKDRFAKKNVFDLLPPSLHHLSPVGRLDKDTEGLLLFTNDGDLAYRLTHPKFNIQKIYMVRIEGKLSDQDRKKLERGVSIEGKKTCRAKITNVNPGRDKTEFSITIHEGRKRQIRLMMNKVGHKVIFLKRIQQGALKLSGLKRGEWREVSAEEMKTIR